MSMFFSPFFPPSLVTLLSYQYVLANEQGIQIPRWDRSGEEKKISKIRGYCSASFVPFCATCVFTREEISAAAPIRDRGLSRKPKLRNVPSNESEPRKPHLRLVQGGNACIKEGNTHVNGCASTLKLGIQWRKLKTDVNNAYHSRWLETFSKYKMQITLSKYRDWQSKSASA